MKVKEGRKDGRKVGERRKVKEGRTEGRKEGRREGRKEDEGRKERRRGKEDEGHLNFRSFVAQDKIGAGNLFAYDHLYLERRRKEGRKCRKKGGRM